MAHAQKPDFVFRRNGRVHLNRRGRQFSRLLAAEVCASAVVMPYTPRSEVVWEYWLPTPFASFPFTSLSRASPCAIRFQTYSTRIFDKYLSLVNVCYVAGKTQFYVSICATSQGNCQCCWLIKWRSFFCLKSRKMMCVNSEYWSAGQVLDGQM